jgi:hypothetical protein
MVFAKGVSERCQVLSFAQCLIVEEPVVIEVIPMHIGLGSQPPREHGLRRALFDAH